MKGAQIEILKQKHGKRRNNKEVWWGRRARTMRPALERRKEIHFVFVWSVSGKLSLKQGFDYVFRLVIV